MRPSRPFVAIATLLLCSSLGAQEPFTANTLKRAPDAPAPAATIDDVAWLAGSWAFEGLGGTGDEMWTEPAGGSMLGLFRLLQDGKPAFYELGTLDEVDGSLVLRIKHFNPDMSGWEEKAETVDFPLVAMSPEELAFEGLTFRRQGEDEFVAFLAFVSGDGSTREERVLYRRRAE